MSTLPNAHDVIYTLGYAPQNPILEKIIQEAANSLELKGIQGYSNASAMQSSLEAGAHITGVQFNDNWSDITDFPQKFSFALRFPSELRTSSSNIPLTWLTMKLFMPIDLSGPRNAPSEDGGLPVGYLREGFLPIQNAISMAYIKLVTNNSELPYVDMQRYPYPAYIHDPLLQGLAPIMSLIMLLSFIYPCTYIVKVSWARFFLLYIFVKYFDFFSFVVYNRGKRKTAERSYEDNGLKQLDSLDSVVCKIICNADNFCNIDNDSNEGTYS